MSMNRHERFEELISASLADDLSDAERAQLDAHLDGCPACRATLASFAEQRRIMAGLRHVAAPRDLGARVRAGVEDGAFAPVPWWRRPAVMFGGLGGGLAVVGGALLAIVLLNGTPDNANIGVGSDSPLPSFTDAAPSAGPTSPPPSATPVASAAASTPSPTPMPPEASPAPDVYLAYTGPFDNLLLTLRDGETGDTIRELGTPGPPIAAELSPNGQFLAYISQQGESGMNQLWVVHLGSDIQMQGLDAVVRIETRLDEWESMELGQSMAGSEFLEHLAWSPSSQYLAFTLAATDGSGPDAWLFDAGSEDVRRLTTTGTGYAASWVADPESMVPDRSRPQLLWISLAGEQPASQLVDVADADTSLATTATFQPLLSPNASHVIYWTGVMAQSEDGAWAFVEGGAPYLADVQASGDGVEFVNERPLFSDVTIDRDAFVSAGIAWGADSDAYAVWDAEWTGLPQGSRGEYPSIRRVYFGHASDERNLTEVHAIDPADLPEGASVVDVKVATTRHLLITAQLPIGGTLSTPRAQLILAARNTGRVPDDIEYFTGPGDDAWFGPAASDLWTDIPVVP